MACFRRDVAHALVRAVSALMRTRFLVGREGGVPRSGDATR
jgi:hypothetical protein